MYPDVIRRSDRLWIGILPDLAIEQCLMRSLKFTGLTESQRHVWIFSTPACAELNNAMQELTGITLSTREQHKDTSAIRLAKDKDDANHILSFLL